MAGIIVLLVLIEVKRVLSVSSFNRMKRGSTILFQTSLMPQSFFNRSVIPPVQGMTFLEIASCSFSSRTILESRDFTTLLI